MNVLLQTCSLIVKLSGEVVEVCGAAVDSSTVLRELVSAASNGDAAAQPTLPLPRAAFAIWLRGACEAREMGWDAILQVLQVGSSLASFKLSLKAGSASSWQSSFSHARKQQTLRRSPRAFVCRARPVHTAAACLMWHTRIWAGPLATGQHWCSMLHELQHPQCHMPFSVQVVHFLHAPYEPWAQRFWEAAHDPVTDACGGVCAGAAALLRSAHHNVMTALYHLYPCVLAPHLSLLQRLERVDSAAQVSAEAQAAYDEAAVRACVQQTATGFTLKVDIAASKRGVPRDFVAVRVAAALPWLSGLEPLRITLDASEHVFMDQLRACEAAAAEVMRAVQSCKGRVCVERLIVRPSPVNYTASGRRQHATSAAPLYGLLAAVAPTLQTLDVDPRASSGIFCDFELEVAPDAGEAESVAAVAAQLTALRRLDMGRFGRVDVTP